MIEKPKKERRFLKILGKVGEILVQELLIKVGKSLVQKIGGKKTLPSIIFLSLFYNIAYASIDSIPYPITNNKQRLGWQTSGNGLVWRGLSADTITKPTSYADKNVKAYLILDSVRGTIFVWRQTYWDSLLVGGGGLTMPFDSITFITAKDGTVGVGEVEYNDTQGSLIQGLKGGNVTNVIGQQLHQRVNNRTGAPLAKGDVVYLSGSQGNRITVAKALAKSDPTSANTFGIVAESIADNASGYVITEGLITGLNTLALTQDSAVYLSGTTAGALTSTKPQAPIHGVYIGVCVKSNAGSGEIFVKIRNGQELDELHDVQITSPVNNASLYYKSSEGLWRDTTAALFVSDTAAMLANYSLKGYVDSIAQNFQDSIDEITNGYFKQEFPTVTKDTLTWTKPVQLPIGGSNLLLVYRNGQMINDAQYSVIDTNKVKINSGSYKLGENYTVVYVKGGGGSGSGGVPFDTSILNLQARLDLKLNISDTAFMLANYATKAYADTTGRFYARQDFSNVSSSTLTWTQSDTLIPGGVNVVQVYRNGQILLPSQYTIPTSTSVVIAATSYKAGENYTVIFPRGGGAGSGGGSGSLTSISAGTGITVSPNPITTTGTVSADLTVMMELTDTASLSNRINLKLNSSDTASLSNRINAKLNISDTLSMLSPYFRDADTTLLNLTSRFALKLNATDTASLSNRINAKGSGTVTSVASGYGITGGTITSTGTLVLDSAVVFSRIRDSIVDVAIGNDTIKILKQEYAPATSSVLTWTVTPKFPIQLKAYILVFRNGQLLINDQYNLTDTNKITIVSNSFKLNSNYTVVTVSGIGSVGSAQAGNPVYPDAGIALSTGSTWASSIPNNSSNWNTAYNDKINSLAVTGTTTKTITLTQQDGGTVSGNFTDNGSVTSVDMTVPTGLSISGNPITTNGTLALSYASGYSLPTDANQNNWTIAYNDKIASLAFTGTSTKTLTLNQTDGGTVSNTFTDLQGVTSVTAGTGLTGGTITSTGTLAVDFGVVAPLANPTFTGTVSGITKNMVGLGNVDNTSDANKPVSTATQTALNLKVNISDTASMLTPYLRKADTTLLNLTSRFAAKLNLSDTLNMLVPYLRKADTTNMLLPYFRDADTTSLNLTSRFNTKQNTLNGTGFVKATGTSITYDNSTYLTTGTAASTYLPLTGGTLTGALSGTSLNLNAGIDASGNFSTSYHTNVSALFRGYQILVAPNNDYGSTRIHFPNRPVTEGFSDFGSGIRHKWAGSDARNSFLSLYTSNNANLQIDAVSIDASGNVGIRDTTPSYTLDVNGTLNATGATTIGSTLAVTGATTLSNLTGTGTRMVVAASDGLLSTQAIQTERYYINLGIVAGAADNSASTYDYSYPANIFIIPTSLNGYCIDSVYIRAIGCSTCPPVSPDLDYYVGVYKANAGARVTTSGATLVGSQITMNEYDLNQVNRNDTLSTGEAWWVYLNGTYTSDMAYITAGFVVKKTCN